MDNCFRYESEGWKKVREIDVYLKQVHVIYTVGIISSHRNPCQTISSAAFGGEGSSKSWGCLSLQEVNLIRVRVYFSQVLMTFLAHLKWYSRIPGPGLPGPHNNKAPASHTAGFDGLGAIGGH